MIDRSTIDRIFSTADIVEVIGDFVKLKKTGANYKGFSPFTNEKTPSFFVSPSKGIFKCFSSGVGGNAVSFLMEHEKYSYPEALKYLAKKYHIEIEEKELSQEEIQEKNDRESIMAVVSFAAGQFEEWLWNREEGKAIGLSYFKERGFRDDIIKEFQLGYSFEKRDALTTLATEKGYKIDYLVKSGITIDKGNYKFDRFSGRVIFPIHSLSGQVVGFGGRTLKKDDKTAKYLNSPESELYHKSFVLYGIKQAKNQIVKQDKCYLVEGYTDVISMYQAGVQNVVASSGTSLTKEQVRLIKRFTKNVTVIYDGDEAGIKASMRGIDIILEEGLNVKILLLPESEDPDSFAKKHVGEKLTEYIEENEADFIRFKTKLLLEDAENDPVKKARLITDIVRTVAVIPESIVRSVYIRECSKMLNIDESILRSETSKIRAKKIVDQEKLKYRTDYQPRKDLVPKQEIKISNEFPHEKDLMRVILQHGDKELRINLEAENPTVFKYVVEEVTNDDLLFQHPVYKIMFEEMVQMHEQELEFDLQVFTRHENPDIIRSTAQLVTDIYELSSIWKKNDVLQASEDMLLSELVPELVMAFKNKKVIDLITENQEEIIKAQSNNDQSSLILLMQKSIILNELKMKFSQNLGDRIII